jgi:DNA invertase Pin-like site-specific DNA recombinase
MKAAIYCRVSTDEQTTENQILAIRKLAEARGYEIVKVYTENETAWKRGHQAELRNCERDAFNHEWSILMFWSMDRLTRQGISSMFRILEGFWEMGITTISLQETELEKGGVIREILISVSAWIAKIDSDRKSERTKAGLARRQSQGFKLGRPKGSPDKRKRQRRADIGEKHRFNKVLENSDAKTGEKTKL